AVFARGDRRLADVLIAAHKKGCRYDGWDEHFKYEKWLEAFSECGIDPEFYAYRRIEHSEVLPWDHIDIGVKKEFLMKEHDKAYAEKTTASCREKCAGCGATSFGGGVCFE
ncbi:MAG: B12-binding domain-containing radical SAM protein, partial [Clostridia bacterium]|nr:B12-binding domain-containing radical SAM protein [Clostridia bacterium]